MADPASVELDTPRRIHVVGIGGAGMSAIATVLAQMGHTVSGSDLKDSPGLARLRALGIRVQVGHEASNVEGAEVLTRSTAIPDRNPEVREAQRRGIPVLRRSEVLAAITRTRRTVAVAGTHGKTTTSSMLALVLVEAGMRPSFIIGGDLNEIGTGAVWDEGEWLVVEADESDGTFLELRRDAAIVTSVEPDHLEHYGGFGSLRDAFEAFVAGTHGPRVVCADDEGAASLVRLGGVVRYGTSEDAEYQMVDPQPEGTGTAFELRRGDRSLGRAHLPVPGMHNARNACAALVCALELGAPVEAGVRALGAFAGVARRFEHRGEWAGVTFIDDYAHLPTEVTAALAAARELEPRRLVCVFQPHRYSRTAALWRDFRDAFSEADLLVLTDVYASGEAPRPGVSGKLILDAVLEAHPHARVAYLPRRRDLVGYLERELRGGDLCLTLGAGDLTSLPDELQGMAEATT